MNEKSYKPRTALGRVVRAARLAAGVTQAGLAAACQTTNISVDSIELGRTRQPRPALLGRIARELGLAPAGLLALAGHCDQSAVDILSLSRPTERVLNTLIPVEPWQSRLAGAYLQMAREKAGRSQAACTARAQTLLLEMVRESQDPKPAAEQIPFTHGNPDDALWSCVEGGAAPGPWLGRSRDVALVDTPGVMLWALATAADADPSIFLYLLGRLRQKPARMAGIDWDALDAAWAAAKLRETPWCDLKEFVGAVRRLRCGESRGEGPTVVRLPDGRWRVEVILPTTIPGPALANLLRQLGEAVTPPEPD